MTRRRRLGWVGVGVGLEAGSSLDGLKAMFPLFLVLRGGGLRRGGLAGWGQGGAGLHDASS